MSLKIRYKIDKENTYTIEVPADSTFEHLINEINKQHECTKYKYVYSKNDNEIIDEGNLISDYMSDESNIFYISENYDINIKDFEDEDEKNKDATSEKDLKDGDDKNAKDSLLNDDDDPPKKTKTHSPLKIDGVSDIKIGNEKELDDFLQTQIGQSIRIKILKEQKKEDFDNDEFNIYSTQTYETMTNPTNIDLSLDSNYEETEAKIREVLKIPEDLQLNIYLSTGVPFFKKYGEEGEDNKLGNFFNDTDTNHSIYVVITRPIAQEILDEHFEEVCNVKDDKRKILMSPVCESTTIGYSRIACLLGTFFYRGVRTTDFIKSIARCTGFAPLVSCIMALYNREPITGLMIATITASLHPIFAKLLPSTITSNKVFDRCLECSCYIVHIEQTYLKGKKKKDGIDAEKLILDKYDLEDDDPEGIIKYLIDCGQTGSFYPFLPDIEYQNELSIAIIDKVPSFTQIEDIFNKYRSFYPIPPLMATNLTLTSILQYVDNQTLLFVNEFDKKKNPELVKIINPFHGEIESVNIIEIGEEVSRNSGGKLEFLIDPNEVEELNIILLDISGSMISRLEDGQLNTKKKKYGVTRIEVAKMCIKTFLKMSFLYRLPHIFSFMTFNTKPKIECEFSPLSPDIEKKLTDDSIKCSLKSAIWNALDEAMNNLIKLNETGKFKNARLRILIFSDGIDLGSSKTKEEILRRAIENDIIIDSIIFALNNKCDDLCKFCQYTGGYSYRSHNVNEFSSFFEKESFLSLRIRSSDRTAIKPDIITPELFEKTKAIYDETIENYKFVTESCICTITTPNYEMSKAIRTRRKLERFELRLLKEMKIFQLSKDENIKLFIKYDDMKSWKIFMKGPDDTEYENKWWFLSITFSKDYPIHPPIFRFISIPYHINVSEDGRVCSSFLLSNYNASFSIYQLVVDVRKLLAKPESQYAIQAFKLNLWNTDKEEFNKLVLKSCEDADNDFDSCVSNYTIKDDVHFEVSENDFENEEDDFLIKSSIFMSKNITKKDSDSKHDDDDDDDDDDV